MGIGDWIIASADVRRVNEETGKKVFLGDGNKFFLDKQVFKNNPRMATPQDKEFVWVRNYSGHRPYVKELKDKHIIFNDDFKAEPGEIWFDDSEISFTEKAEPYIVVEPEVKSNLVHTVNKSWPVEYWKTIAKESLPFIQLGETKNPIFPHRHTDTFRQALAILKRAKLFVGTDGALHHAAAALGIPAVVIWTGFSSPKYLGYDDHYNIHDGSEPCGYYGGVCKHCLAKARAISPNRVLEAIYEKYSRHLSA